MFGTNITRPVRGLRDSAVCSFYLEKKAHSVISEVPPAQYSSVNNNKLLPQKREGGKKIEISFIYFSLKLFLYFFPISRRETQSSKKYCILIVKKQSLSYDISLISTIFLRWASRIVFSTMQNLPVPFLCNRLHHN